MTLDNRIPPPVVAVLVAAIMLGMAWLVPSFDFPWRTAIAIAVAALGVAIALGGVLQFRRARTTVNPLTPGAASALVIAGVYRWTRNPMYLGMALALAGWGIWLGNPGSLAAIALFVLWINRFQIAPEERALAARFGADFDHYRRRVRRWI